MGAMCKHNTEFVCPPLKSYSQKQQDRILQQYENAELEAKYPDLLGFVNDHSDLRDAVKVCLSRRAAEIKKRQQN